MPRTNVNKSQTGRCLDRRESMCKWILGVKRRIGWERCTKERKFYGSKATIVICNDHAVWFACSVGLFVGEYPVLTVVLSLIFCGLCGIGLKTFSETDSQEKLWVPQSSRLINEKEWVDQVFPDTTRFVSIVMESEGSVLTSTFLSAVSILFLQFSSILFWKLLNTVCVISYAEKRRKKIVIRLVLTKPSRSFVISSCLFVLLML